MTRHPKASRRYAAMPKRPNHRGAVKRESHAIRVRYYPYVPPASARRSEAAREAEAAIAHRVTA